MPHFIIDCSEKIVQLKSPQQIMQVVYNAANFTNLFEPEDIKVRINSFNKYLLAEGKNDFIHVFGNIMGGRSTNQKADLSRRIVTVLTEMFPDVPIISMNIRDFEKATYCNRNLIEDE